MYNIVKNDLVFMQDMVKAGRSNDPNNIGGRILHHNIKNIKYLLVGLKKQ